MVSTHDSIKSSPITLQSGFLSIHLKEEGHKVKKVIWLPNITCSVCQMCSISFSGSTLHSLSVPSRKLTSMTTSKVSLPRWVQPMGVLVGYGRAGGEWDQGSCSLAFFLGSHLGLAAALSWRSKFPSDTPLWVIITTSFSVSLGPRTSNRPSLVHYPVWFPFTLCTPS